MTATYCIDDLKDGARVEGQCAKAATVLHRDRTGWAAAVTGWAVTATR
jgi:hypothetical protein